MSQLREVFLNIGKQSYSVKTRLDKETLERVRSMINEACGSPVKGVSQEDLLMLTCLQLAYMLDTVSGKLFMLHEDLAAAMEKEWPPAEEAAEAVTQIEDTAEESAGDDDAQPPFLAGGTTPL